MPSRTDSSAPTPATGSPEALVVALAQTGDRAAFAELVRRRQTWLRGLMHRCCSDPTLADDLAQQAFLLAWRDLRGLRDPKRFGPWLKRVAINVWLKHLRTHDPLRHSDNLDTTPLNGPRPSESADVGMDLERALTSLSDHVRLCVVLSYQEGMSHQEIATATDMPLGTVKSHIRRGAEQLRQGLSAYANTNAPTNSNNDDSLGGTL